MLPALDKLLEGFALSRLEGRSQGDEMTAARSGVVLGVEAQGA